MLIVLLKAISFFCIIVLGYVLKKKQVFKKEDFYIISRIVVNLTLPGAIISNFNNLNITGSLLLMALLGIGCGGLMMLTGWWLGKGRSKEEQAFQVINLSGYNVGCFTLPFIQSFVGPVGIAAITFFDAGNAVICTGTSYGVASGILNKKGASILKTVGKSLSRSTPFIACVCMTVLAFFHISLPYLAAEFAATLGNANTFLALFMIGIGFEIHWNRETVNKLALMLAARYIPAVLLSFCCFLFLPFELEIRQTAAILMLGPIASMAPAFTGRMEGDVELSSVLNSCSIMISIVCISLSLLILL